MRIGIDALWTLHGGSFTNLAQLLMAWRSRVSAENLEIVLFTTASGLQRLESCGAADGVEVVVLGGTRAGQFSRMIAEQIKLPILLKRFKVELLFCPANMVPLATRTPCVVAFQNAAPFCRDEAGVAPTSLSDRARLACLELFMKISAQRAAGVIFISQWFQKHFHKKARIKVSKEVVIHRAADLRLSGAATRVPFRETTGVKPPYFLSVAHFYPYKCLEELVKGFLSLAKTMPASSLQLVLVGGDGYPEYRRRIEHLVDARNAREKILMTGPLPAASVERLLRECAVFVFTSNCENCPTALIEALASGAAIACSDGAVMREIAHDAVMYFNPNDPSDVNRVLARLISDPELARDLRQRARCRAQELGGVQEMAAKTLAFLTGVADTRN